MKRLWVLLLILGLTLGLTAPAGAAPPSEKNPSHPQCPPPPPQVGLTCFDWAKDRDDRYYDSSNRGQVIIPLGVYDSYCVDVTDVKTGNWTIDIVAHGNLIVQTIVLRDSVLPGDVCDAVHPNKVKDTEMHTLTGIMSEGVDGCGEEFGDDDPAFAFLVFSRGTGTMTVRYPAS